MFSIRFCFLKIIFHVLPDWVFILCFSIFFFSSLRLESEQLENACFFFHACGLFLRRWEKHRQSKLVESLSVENSRSRNDISTFSYLFLLQASGVTVSDVCKTTYEEIKKDKKHRYVIFYIRDEKQIDVEVIGDRNAEYDQFLEDIQKGGAGECRYGLFDFEYMHQCQGTSESSKKQKLFLMSWCPDTAKVSHGRLTHCSSLQRKLYSF